MLSMSDLIYPYITIQVLLIYSMQYDIVRIHNNIVHTIHTKHLRFVKYLQFKTSYKAVAR